MKRGQVAWHTSPYHLRCVIERRKGIGRTRYDEWELLVQRQQDRMPFFERYYPAHASLFSSNKFRMGFSLLSILEDRVGL